MPKLSDLSFEELQNRQTEILKRLQKLRSWGQGDSEMWNQLQYFLDELETEKQERLAKQDMGSSDAEDYVVVNTDPLPDDVDTKRKPKQQQKQYTVL